MEKESPMKKLINGLMRGQVIRNQRIADAMLKVDRGHFCPGYNPYEDCPQLIGYEVTISAPHMHAYCLEWVLAKLNPGAKVLDVGCGSGYLCAAFYELVKDTKNLNRTAVVGIEHIEPLADLSIKNLQKGYANELSTN